MKKIITALIISSCLFAFDFTFTRAFNDFNQGLNLINKNPSLADKKFKEAYKLLKKITNKNSSQVYYMLGRIYSNGWGVNKNYLLAQKYLLKAIKLGNKMAICCLARLYLKMNKPILAQKYLKISLSDKAISQYCNDLLQKLNNMKEQQ